MAWPVRIFIDADACPVKEEVDKVAWRRGAGEGRQQCISPGARTPAYRAGGGAGSFDAADDWIAGEGDILLAARCLKSGATVIGQNGKRFTSASIGSATRAIMADLRAGVGITGGPSPFAKSDRSRFLQALDDALVRLGK